MSRANKLIEDLNNLGTIPNVPVGGVIKPNPDIKKKDDDDDSDEDEDKNEKDTNLDVGNRYSS